MKKLFIALLFCLVTTGAIAEDGYQCWLRYTPVQKKSIQATYRSQITAQYSKSNSPTIQLVQQELHTALQGLLATTVPSATTPDRNGTLIADIVSALPASFRPNTNDLSSIGNEGFIIRTITSAGKKMIVITAHTPSGVLYGTYHFLRLLQTQQSIASLHVVTAPRMTLRLLNHWDNLDRTVERGYAGFSLWNWHTLPGYIDPRYIDYARLNASIGINGTVLTNVNANATVLTNAYLQKCAAIANVFRPFGIKIYLTARFSAPVEIGGLTTADPLDPQVQQWWKKKTDEIYQLIPDFGGFLVKANSEGQPGPQNYGRTHVDGANMLADALAPHQGIVMWRAFVYTHESPDDRHKQAFNEFVPLDGQFRTNVMIQVKNGAIDFMPREPFHPLFGAMPKTPLMMEFQVTQEYLGQGTQLAYLAPLFKECLDSDTYSNGPGSTVASILEKHTLNGMAGVSNIGSDINWTGHPLAQANWYALGRLLWDHQLSARAIAQEWLRMTFTNDTGFVNDLTTILLSSRETVVQYMNPLGLHHLMATGHHYGPGPWVNNLSRSDWNPVYYHKADSLGIGFNRTATGSNALSQYQPGARKNWEDSNTCDERYLLWFHHVSWNHRMKTGRTLWNELCFRYNDGVNQVRTMQQVWNSQQTKIDAQRFTQVRMLLDIQLAEAIWWRNACVLYFQTFSRQPLPGYYEQPDHTLDYYKQLRFPYAPGN